MRPIVPLLLFVPLAWLAALAGTTPARPDTPQCPSFHGNLPSVFAAAPLEFESQSARGLVLADGGIAADGAQLEPAASASRIFGAVVDGEGAPLPCATLGLYLPEDVEPGLRRSCVPNWLEEGSEARPCALALSGEDGTFEFACDPGLEFRLALEDAGAAHAAYFEPLRVRADSVAIRFVAERPALEVVPRGLAPEDPGELVAIERQAVERDGPIPLEFVPGDAGWTARVTPGRVYCLAWFAPNRPLVWHEVAVVPGAPRTHFEFDVPPPSAAGELRLRILDPQSQLVAGVHRISITSLDPHVELREQCVTEQSQLRLPPGRFLVALLSSDFEAQALVGVAATCSIAEAGTSRLDLVLPPTGGLVVRFRRDDTGEDVRPSGGAERVLHLRLRDDQGYEAPLCFWSWGNGGNGCEPRASDPDCCCLPGPSRTWSLDPRGTYCCASAVAPGLYALLWKDAQGRDRQRPIVIGAGLPTEVVLDP